MCCRAHEATVQGKTIYVGFKSFQKNVAKFIVPDWGIKLTPAYRVVAPTHQATSASRPLRQPYAVVNFMNLATAV